MSKAVASFLICLSLFAAQRLQAQEKHAHPYIGGSLNFLGVSQPGWGVDGGVKYGAFYAGLEYGSYGHEVATASLVAGQSYHSIFEDYYGVHAGIVVASVVYCGLVVLHSRRQDVVGNIATFFNIGPDIRLQPMSHLLLALAYTLRRGLNAGIGYEF